MAMTEDDYRDQLQQLFPPGPAFDPELQPDVAQLIAGSAPELARVDAAAAQLSLEQNPATVTWLLADWEAYLGLPDACTVPGSQTLEERRQAVINKLTATGAPQRSYYLSLANQAGVEAQIAEFRPPRAGPAVAGDFLYGDGWPWSWQVQVPIDLFATVEAAVLDCRLQLEAPEYTDVRMGFGLEVVQAIAEKVDQLFNAIHYVAPAAVGGYKDL
ncbi:YmfQ family protein [Pseudomonas sp. CIP-10]|uniref:YmfQ family protein n=1 Tax=Pseudomonas sp. CIP-10 TaxID=2892442 RepID=UPI001E37EA92|nr:YmfQ family protein [Pseudomonas sp. CIP-10]UFH28833.1 YmfQ family protein [Pseudomonas sp. CIP-10]